MKLSKLQWALVVLLVIPGVYFLLFHRDPLPFNHEAVGIGTLHAVHDAIGLVLIGVAGWIVWRGRGPAPAAPGT